MSLGTEPSTAASRPKRAGRRHTWGLFSSRKLLRHFRRLALPVGHAQLRPERASAEQAAPLLQAAQQDEASLLQRFGTQLAGLDATQAAQRLREHGANEIGQERPLRWYEHLWACYRNPFNLLLSLLALVSYFTQDLKAAVVIGSMVVFSTALRFVQEARSNHAAEKLRAMVQSRATVLRDARAQELPLSQLVPGDIVQLSAGDMIPADLRVLGAKDLFVSQGALTGESLPVEKFAQLRAAAPREPLDCETLCFMGTNVVSGAATALVIATADQTYFGALAQRVAASNGAANAFQAGVNRLSWLLIRFMLVMSPLVLIINGVTKHDWLEAFLFALSIAVGLTPEMLPMIVTATLARGAVALSRQKVIVKRLDAIQNLGAMDVLCTDKTGTLTQDRIALQRHTDAQGRESAQVLDYALLNSHYQTGLKNLLDVAVLEHGAADQQPPLLDQYQKLDEIPFDFERRRMSVLVARGAEAPLLICKGAVEEVLQVCANVRDGEQELPLDAARLAQIREVAGKLNGEGLRVVGVATRTLPPAQHAVTRQDEAQLTLQGYIAFLDPPKDSTAPALRALKDSGVTVKILTGDNERVTAQVCRQVGLPVTRIVLGPELEGLDETRLRALAEEATVFARMTPAQKERLVRCLHQAGHVVGFLGDGINDAPALRAADVGISVDTAVDIAKEAADLILLEKSLMVLHAGVREGRRTFANMLKYIKLTASSNFGNVFSVLIAGALLPFLPMLPLHLLVQNLLYDFSQSAIPFDSVDEEFLSRPQHWQPEDVSRFMLHFGPLSSIFDLITFALLWFGYGASTPATQSLFQSGWFVEGLLSQTLIVHLIRSRAPPWAASRPGRPLLLATAAVVLIGLTLPQSPLAAYFKLQALPGSYFICLLVILLAYAALVQAMKGAYTRRYGWQ
ncbi:Mg2+-importing ATPase [Solimonas aquatica]|uniref:Magnesium-transporting ATPase, P-type 1 n=1 Tax=Solimonas aquatica TaxID=489703 RepID=A0A1H9L019_9GAMM|nr:magnesium-translocating P-type ATPase [Solimonas aquatica]SER04782.1 Mg2+-importing ATPase [Solimonas aquatica]